jgi:transmembrane sensor
LEIGALAQRLCVTHSTPSFFDPLSDEQLLAASQEALAAVAVTIAPGELREAMDELQGRLDRESRSAERLSVVARGSGKQTSIRDRKRFIPDMRAGRRLVAAFVAVLFAVVGAQFFSSSASVSDVRFQTNAGERTTVRLSDGSRVRLSPSTTVTVSGTTVSVVGEARFAIVASISRPVVVQTANAIVQVLGTEFVVRHYAHEARTQLIVDEGKVAMRTRGRRVTQAIVVPRMWAQVSDSGIAVTSGIASTERVRWTSGTLVFKQASLREVVAALSRTYGVNITVADSALARRTLSADVEVLQLPLPRVLDFIGVVMNTTSTHERNGYVLSPAPPGTESLRQSPQKRLPQPEKKQYGR